MKKIRLDLDALAVETFATERNGETEQGTVRANSGEFTTIGCVPVNPTYGTGEIHCVCENLDEQVTRPVGCAA